MTRARERLFSMSRSFPFLGLILIPIVALSISAQSPRLSLKGCWEFTAGRESLSSTSGGGYGALPRTIEFTDSLLFAREGDPTFVMRVPRNSDSADHWSSSRIIGTWHPHSDSVFAVLQSRRTEAGVGLRFRILGDSLSGMARPFTKRTRWEADVSVSAHRVACVLRRP